MGIGQSADAASGPFPAQCAASLACPQDLTWLLHMAAARMRAKIDRLAAEAGLNDCRDWMVLAALSDGPQCTQLELSRMLGLDKTTLIAVLDRLEQRQLIVRTADPSDRRVRIPRITDAGRNIQTQFAVARDAAEAELLEGVDPVEREVLVRLLTQIAELQPAAVSV
jgi:DNA-binding MarR family transcriptional regulator